MSIEPGDRLYRLAAQWAAAELHPGERRPLIASLRFEDDGRRPAVVTTLDAKLAVTVLVDGHPIRVSVGEKDTVDTAGGVKHSPDDSRPWEPPRLVFSARSRAGRDAVLALFGRLAATEGSVPQLYQRGPWGDWMSRALPGRPLTSVILRDGLVDELSTDLARFLSAEQLYARMGLPWHRGYVLHGPPGTGKTSLVRALATEHRLDVYYLSLSGLKSDVDLASLLARIPGRCILLIEDLDTHHAAHQRTDDTETPDTGVTLAGLLNALDGLVTPHGLVTVITTNHLDRLDDALLRPGRADKRIHVDQPDPDQVRRIIATFAPDALPYWPTGVILRADLTTAALVNAIKEHLDAHPQAQAAALIELATGITVGYLDEPDSQIVGVGFDITPTGTTLVTRSADGQFAAMFRGGFA